MKTHTPRPPLLSRATAHDRWIVSYADFMTLLFAFFAVAYAVPVLPAVTTPVGPAAPSADAREELDELREALERRLSDALQSARVEIARDTRGLVLSLPDAATFATGSAEVRPEAQRLIEQIVAVVEPLPLTLQVEGHTDDVPIQTSTYESNWELSTARASAVVAMLITRAGFAPSRLSAAGYGEFRPRVPNDSDEHRARNRRVDIVVVQ